MSIGQPLTRREDQRFLTGLGRYAENTVPQGCAAVLFVRSPNAHALIKSVDKSAAASLLGVIAIYTAEDAAADKLGHLPTISEIKDAAGNRHREPAHLPMPVGKVRHVGDIVVSAYDSTNNRTVVDLYADADATPDARIYLTGDHHALAAGDFVL